MLTPYSTDLVDQPNAILDRMKDGTYVINYTLTAQSTRPATTISMQSIENEVVDTAEDATMWESEDKLAPLKAQSRPTATNAPSTTQVSSMLHGSGAGAVEGSMLSDQEALDLVSTAGVDSLQTEGDKRVFHKMLLGEVRSPRFCCCLHSLTISHSRRPTISSMCCR